MTEKGSSKGRPVTADDPADPPEPWQQSVREFHQDWLEKENQGKEVRWRPGLRLETPAARAYTPQNALAQGSSRLSGRQRLWLGLTVLLTLFVTCAARGSL